MTLKGGGRKEETNLNSKYSALKINCMELFPFCGCLGLKVSDMGDLVPLFRHAPLPAGLWSHRHFVDDYLVHVY